MGIAEMTETNLIILSYRKEYLLLAREEVFIPESAMGKRDDDNPSHGGK